MRRREKKRATVNSEERSETVSNCPECAAHEAAKAEKLSALREVNADLLAKKRGLRIVETLSGLTSGVDDSTVGGGPWTDLHDHERAMIAKSAALVGKVPTP